MTNEDILNLQMVCGGCGKLMRPLGEWPIQFPRDDNGAKNVLQVARWMCQSCRLPHPDVVKGMPLGIAVFLE